MRFAFSIAVFAALFIAFVGKNSFAEQPGAQMPAAAQAGELVQRALEAESQGKGDERAALLSQARQIDPDLESVHWNFGDVQYEGKWTHFDGPVQDATRVAKLQEYRAKRDQAAYRYEDQMQLADWCDKNGLPEQQRSHLMVALKLRPNSPEALKKFGLVSYRKTWIVPSQIEAFDAEVKQQQENYLKWKDRLGDLQAKAENKQTKAAALKELSEISDEAAIPPMEAIFGKGRAEPSKAVIESLAKMPYQSATNSLMKFALYAPNAEVRQTAAKALKPRSIYGYVPQLISRLDTPLAVRYQEFQSANGAAAYQMSLYKETPLGDKVYNSWGINDPTVRAFDLVDLPTRPGARFRPTQLPNNPSRVAGDLANEAGRAERLAVRTEAVNETILASNERVTDALQTATGQELGEDPIVWFKWWTEFNEYALPEMQPTEYGFDSTYSSPFVPTLVISSTRGIVRRQTMSSCFPAGTPVRTLGGLKQIENIRPGELVLATNQKTGELAYKAVLETTVGPPISLINIQVGEQFIRCSRGHPFWICGSGWKMAKELKPGDWVHSIDGPVMIDSVESEKDKAVCYNLLVAGFNTYFVGKQDLLVHDFSLRQPTEAIVPGLVKLSQ